MLEKQQLVQILDACLSQGGDFAEIFEEKKYTSSYRLLNDVVENANSGIVFGVGLRIFDGTNSVYAYTNQADFEHVMETANRLAGSIHQNRIKKALPLEDVLYENKHPISKMPSEYGSDVKTAIMRKAAQAALDYDDKIVKAAVSYMDEQQHVIISNSEGKRIEDTRVRTRIAVSAIAQNKDKMQDGMCAPGASKGLEFYDEIHVEKVGQEAARIALVMLEADECPSGVMPVIIDHGFGGVIFHEACGHSLEASAVAKKQSVFADKLGQKIAADCVSAVDDGTIPNAWGSCNIDDEGNFMQRNVLIENGILKNYMIDQLNGRRMEMEASGSSRRQSYKFEPTSRMTNTFILEGNNTLEEMIEATQYGLYCKNMGGGSVDPSTGDFNFAVSEGYLIENGKIVKPVKGATLIGNGADTLMKIDFVGNNLARAQGMCGASSGSIPTDVGQPAIRVSSMIVGGKEGESYE